MSKQKCDFIFKLVLLGDSAVGKTNILMRFLDPDNYKPSHLPTIGVDFKAKIIDLEQYRVKVQLWDTAGQERFKTITENYYRGASGIIMVYSIIDRRTFSNITSWVTQIMQRQENPTPMVLVGNKSDLSNQRCVSFEEGQNLAKQLGMMFFQTSAKEGANIEEVFDGLCRKILKKEKEEMDKEPKIVTPLVPLKSPMPVPGCCASQ